MSDLRERLLSADWVMPDVELVRSIARTLAAAGDRALAATAYDRAYALAPHHEDLRRERAALLDTLTLVEHGITWKYIPAGPFIMGSEQGDADESPPHAVELEAYYLADAPVTWAAYCAAMGFSPPPAGVPGVARDRERDFTLMLENKIRRRYCASGKPFSEAAEDYSEKPIVCVSRATAVAFCDALSTPGARVRLPTEAEWEKAARGGLVGAEYPWGDAPPSPLLCDCDRFGDFTICAPRSLPANGYGLYAMSGGVWEWVLDGYDADFYARAPRRAPLAPETDGDHVLRGGSWADCPSAVRVSFRMGMHRATQRHTHPWLTPTVGFRPCRVAQ